MAEIIRLLYGRDRRNPTRELNLNENITTGNLFLQEQGIAPGAGLPLVTYTGVTRRNEKQRRVSSARDNAVLTIRYEAKGSSKAELVSLLSEINRFFIECGVYEEMRRGHPVWLQYRMDEGLTNVPEPVYGQLSQFYRVIFGNIPAWPDSLYSQSFKSHHIPDIVCTLTCEPDAYGLPQLAATGTGQLEQTDDGVLVAEGITNLFTNPTFGHPTDFDNGWSGSLTVAQETRPQFTKYLGRGVRLTNLTILGHNITQTLTLTADAYVCSWLLRKLDGSAITSSDVEIVIQGSTQTTTFVSLGDGWYLAYGSATAAASSSTHGLNVKPLKQVFAAAAQIEIASGNLFNTNYKPSPFCAGHLIGCSWSGTAHESSSSRPDPAYSLSLQNELTGLFTVSFWGKFLFDNDWLKAGVDCTIFANYLDSSNFLILYFDDTSDKFVIWHKLVTVETSDTLTGQSINYGEWVHFCIVQADGTLYVYIDGVEALSIATDAVFAANGSVSLGDDIAAGTVSSAIVFDGLKIWDADLTATEVAALYANEYEVKANGKTISPTPVLWGKDGDGGIDAVDGVVSSAAKDNWGVLVGVPGTEPALTEIHADPPTSSPPYVYWVGRLETDEAFTPDGSLWLDYSGTADAGNSSGDAYQQTTASSGTPADLSATIDEARVVRGRFQVMGRFYATTYDVDVQPYFRLGASNRVLYPAKTIVTDANFLLQDFGDLVIDWPHQSTPPTMAGGLYVTGTNASNSTIRLDYLCLLPFPYARVEVEETSPTFASGDTLVISSDRVAWVLDASDNDSQLYHCHYRGEPVTVIPHKYNYLVFLLGADGATYDVAKSLTNVKIYVTPRWTLPGQAVG